MHKIAALALLALLAVSFVSEAAANNCHTSCYGGKINNKQALMYKMKLFDEWSKATGYTKPQILARTAVKGFCDAALIQYKFKTEAWKVNYQTWEKSNKATKLYAPLKANPGKRLPAGKKKEYKC